MKQVQDTQYNTWIGSILEIFMLYEFQLISYAYGSTVT